ncbi:MAG: hypothetical protein ACI4TX_04670, partial [Christensenellales bacterium]
MEKDKKYCWKLDDFYKDLNEFDNDFKNVQKYLSAFGKYKNHLGEKDVLLEYLNLKTKMNNEVDKLAMYMFLSEDLNFNDDEIKLRKDKLENFFSKLSIILTPLETELSKQSEKYFDDCINDKRFYDYKMKLDIAKNSRIHTLSEKEENIFALMSSFNSGFEDIYTNIMNNDMTHKPVIVNGKEEKLTSQNYITFLKNEDREVRKQAFINRTEAINKRYNSAITAYIYKIKQDCMDLKLRKYDSMLDAVLEEDKIPKEVYYKLVDKVQANADFVQKFYEIKKRALHFDKFYVYDSYLPLVSKVDKKLTIEEQLNIMRKALQPLGDDYCSNIDKAIAENWFDLYPDDNKVDRTFATMSSSLKHPYVFMHQRFDLDSLGDLIHEFGHAVNFRYIMDKQTSNNNGSSIYNAEIASITNEILLANYQYNNTNDLDEKIFYLEKIIDNFIGTMITQTKFSQFEDFAYKLVENDEPITVDILCNKWVELSKLYNGKSFDKIEEAEKFKNGAGFIVIHHFVYSAYYVFNYATSYACAYNIA